MARDTAASVTTWRDAVLADDIGSSSVVGGLRPGVRPAEQAAPARSRMPPAEVADGAAGLRCSWVMVVAHSLDLIALGLLASVAALLRYGNLYLVRPPLRGVGGLCSHLDQYALPLREPAVALPPAAVYVLAIVAPVVLIVVLELVFAYALRRSIARAAAAQQAGQADESWRVFFLKRTAKSLLVFLLGLCLVSVLADALRLLVSRPRPYFLSTGPHGYERYCTQPEDEALSSQERDARLSFPSHRCSVLAFAGAAVALHGEQLLGRVRAGGMYVLRALLLLVAAVPALAAASQCLDSRTNHWQDVAAGLVLGAALAAYADLVLGHELALQAEIVATTPVAAGRRGQLLPRVRPVAGPALRGPHGQGPVEAVSSLQPYQRLTASGASLKTDDAFY